MSDPTPTNPPKPNRRKSGSHRLDPIDWHEFANDAVLNGNMSTLFHRPPTEDPSAYASPEALLEIEKRTRRQANADADPRGADTRVCSVETHLDAFAPACENPTAGVEPTESHQPTVGPLPTVGPVPPGRKIRPLRDVHDALTLAGQILYKAMYGQPDGTAPRQCAKGYRQLAAETHLDKDTVRDLIADFKAKGMLREIGAYNPDTRSSKTYEVFSSQAILQMWRQAGICFVTSGRQRPEFCTAQGQPAIGPR
jgi:hypothetical protein